MDGSTTQQDAAFKNEMHPLPASPNSDLIAETKVKRKATEMDQDERRNDKKARTDPSSTSLLHNPLCSPHQPGFISKSTETSEKNGEKEANSMDDRNGDDERKLQGSGQEASSKFTEELGIILNRNGGVSVLKHMPRFERMMVTEQRLKHRWTLLTVMELSSVDCQKALLQGNILQTIERWLVEAKDVQKIQFLEKIIEGLDRLPVDFSALKSCTIGKTLGKLRHHEVPAVKQKATALVQKWKLMVDAASGSRKDRNQGGVGRKRANQKATTSGEEVSKARRAGSIASAQEFLRRTGSGGSAGSVPNPTVPHLKSQTQSMADQSRGQNAGPGQLGGMLVEIDDSDMFKPETAVTRKVTKKKGPSAISDKSGWGKPGFASARSIIEQSCLKPSESTKPEDKRMTGGAGEKTKGDSSTVSGPKESDEKIGGGMDKESGKVESLVSTEMKSEPESGIDRENVAWVEGPPVEKGLGQSTAQSTASQLPSDPALQSPGGGDCMEIDPAGPIGSTSTAPTDVFMTEPQKIALSPFRNSGPVNFSSPSTKQRMPQSTPGVKNRLGSQKLQERANPGGSNRIGGLNSPFIQNRGVGNNRGQLQAKMAAEVASRRVPSPEPAPQKVKLKSVSWVSDSELVSVRWFKKTDPPENVKRDSFYSEQELLAEERAARMKHYPFQSAARQEHMQEQEAMKQHKLDVANKRRELQDRLQHMNARIPWTTPPSIELDPEWKVAFGEGSEERAKQAERESRSVSMNFAGSQITPSNPIEPPEWEKRCSQSPKPTAIPLDVPGQPQQGKTVQSAVQMPMQGVSILQNRQQPQVQGIGNVMALAQAGIFNQPGQTQQHMIQGFNQQMAGTGPSQAPHQTVLVLQPPFQTEQAGQLANAAASQQLPPKLGTVIVGGRPQTVMIAAPGSAGPHGNFVQHVAMVNPSALANANQGTIANQHTQIVASVPSTVQADQMHTQHGQLVRIAPNAGVLQGWNTGTMEAGQKLPK